MTRLAATGVVLAGGRSLRMGVDKRFVQVGRHSMLTHVLQVLEDLFEDVLIVTGSPEPLQAVRNRVVHDIIPERAALGGIYTGLTYAAFDHAFVAACDMPFLDRSVVRLLVELAQEGGEHQPHIVIPRLGKRLHPTHAVYSKPCLPFLRHMIECHDLQAQKICEHKELLVRYVSDDELRIVAQDFLSFVNVNTPQELDEARKIVRSGQPPHASA